MAMNMTLQYTIRDINRKNNSLKKIDDLEKQLTYLQGRKAKHEAVIRETQQSMEKSSAGLSLSRMMSGENGKNMDQKRRELYEARVNLESVTTQIAAVEADLVKERQIVASIGDVESAYSLQVEELKHKARSNSDVMVLERRILQYDAELLQYQVTIDAAKEAEHISDNAFAALQQAKGLESSGFFANLMGNKKKKEHLIDEAQSQIQQLQIAVRRFKNELNRIKEISGNTVLKFESFLKFSDYFFADVFLEWKESMDIQNVITKVEGIRWKLSDATEELKKEQVKLESCKKLVEDNKKAAIDKQVYSGR